MQSHMKPQVRIIGGKWRGRKLPVVEVPGLRPTPDRVRETLFNWLARDCPQASVLDCFAGTGCAGAALAGICQSAASGRTPANQRY
jgi:16S rRNA (guanine966-N2)-methyltransferase